MDKIHSSIPNCGVACIVYCVLCIVIVIVQVHISSLPSPQVLEWVIMIMSVFDWDVLLLESISSVLSECWPDCLTHCTTCFPAPAPPTLGWALTED